MQVWEDLSYNGEMFDGFEWHVLITAWKCSNGRFILAGINNPPWAHVAGMTY